MMQWWADYLDEAALKKQPGVEGVVASENNP
jgi:hypothetical protein